MSADRPHADEQGLSDLAIGATFGDKRQDLQLTGAEVVIVGTAALDTIGEPEARPTGDVEHRTAQRTSRQHGGGGGSLVEGLLCPLALATRREVGLRLAEPAPRRRVRTSEGEPAVAGAGPRLGTVAASQPGSLGPRLGEVGGGDRREPQAPAAPADRAVETVEPTRRQLPGADGAQTDRGELGEEMALVGRGEVHPHASQLFECIGRSAVQHKMLGSGCGEAGRTCPWSPRAVPSESLGASSCSAAATWPRADAIWAATRRTSTVATGKPEAEGAWRSSSSASSQRPSK